jgi:hypothetical protein
MQADALAVTVWLKQFLKRCLLWLTNASNQEYATIGGLGFFADIGTLDCVRVITKA